MTLNCELFQNEFSVLSGKLIKNMFLLHICRPNDYIIEFIVLLQIYVYKIFTNVLSIIFKYYFPLPKIYNEIPKKLFTIIMYQLNSMS